MVACWLYGGIVLPFAIGAVVDPFWGFQTPLSGQLSPVRAVVPIGLRMWISPVTPPHDGAVKINHDEIVVKAQQQKIVKIYHYDCAYDLLMETFGQRLRKYRMAKKMSLQELADAVGASKAHVWELETGKTKNPSLALLTAFSRALDVPIKELVGETETTDDAQLAPLFRDLRGLDEADLKMIKSLTDQLRARKDGSKAGD